MPNIDSDVSLDDLYLAYRKAKADAFYESSHFHALAYVEYEHDLDANLRRLAKRINSDNPWPDARSIGTYAHLPKSVEQRPELGRVEGVFFKCLDPMEEWHRQWSPESRAAAAFRLVICPTVEFQVFSALWIIRAGHVFDAVLDPDVSFGHRLRRAWSEGNATTESSRKPLNPHCAGLFEPYFSAYRAWRAKGLKAMRRDLEADRRVFAITMDIQSFYHRVSSDFLLSNAFLERFGITLDPVQRWLTKMLVDAINTWYASTPDALRRPSGGLPVGLSASKIVANVLLAEFDEQVLSNLRPSYYGRYVDDIFLVLNGDLNVYNGTDMMRWLATRLTGLLEFEPASEDSGDRLRLRLKYAPDAELIFSGHKQKVFNLLGRHGLDLVSHINQQIQLHSSEHRLLSVVPSTGEEMAARTLLAQSDASLEPDALRKADVVSVKRLGLALLLRDMEAYARDLRSREWKSVRLEFYGLVNRHILCPTGFFDFVTHIPRVLGLMVASGDFDEALVMIDRLAQTCESISKTTTAGTTESGAFRSCLSLLKRALGQATLQATTVAHFTWGKKLLLLGKALDRVDPSHPLPRSVDPFRRLSKRLLYADMGRRPYREVWLAGAVRALKNPRVPDSLPIRRLLRLGAIRAFRRAAELRVPYWPAVAFPTRPLSLSEITLAAPALLQQPRELRSALHAMRGSKARTHEGVLVAEGGAGSLPLLQVDGKFKEKVRFAIPSFLTSDREWRAALSGKPELTLARYERIRRVVNGIMREAPLADYVVFPECSIPSTWVGAIARKLAERRISLIAGLEYRKTSAGIRNDAYLSIATDWPWHKTSVIYVQPKFAPAHDERRALASERKRLYVPPASRARPTIVQHEIFFFAVLICSDLTNIAHRKELQGKVDALVVVEWNRDIETFGSLVESTANDLHAFVIQSNNRQFGDSRIRAPRKQSFERDIVRVRGGAHDYFVIAELDVAELRQFQLHKSTTSDGPFKPTPIGYAISAARGGPRQGDKGAAASEPRS